MDLGATRVDVRYFKLLLDLPEKCGCQPYPNAKAY